jgi:hypothetical protein
MDLGAMNPHHTPHLIFHPQISHLMMEMMMMAARREEKEERKEVMTMTMALLTTMEERREDTALNLPMNPHQWSPLTILNTHRMVAMVATAIMAMDTEV